MAGSGAARNWLQDGKAVWMASATLGLTPGAWAKDAIKNWTGSAALVFLVTWMVSMALKGCVSLTKCVGSSLWYSAKAFTSVAVSSRDSVCSTAIPWAAWSLDTIFMRAGADNLPVVDDQGPSRI